MTTPLDRIGPVSNPPTLLEVARIMRSWRDMDFDDVASLFYAETGHMRPGKDVAARDDSQAPHDVRAAAFARWCSVKTDTIEILLGIAIEHAERQAAGVKAEGGP